MTKAKFDRLFKAALNAKSKLDGACEDMANILQPFFPNEIFVIYQESDGFVVLVDNGSWKTAPLNEPVKEVFKNIKTNKNYYK